MSAPSPDCTPCGPGLVCAQGTCGPGPHSVSYGFENDALPTSQSLTPGSDAVWTVSNMLAHTGQYAARSGAILPDQASILSVAAPFGQESSGTLWYAVDGDPSGDQLTFTASGAPPTPLPFTGAGWQSFDITNFPPGGSLSVRYARGAASTLGAGFAYIDDVSFTAIAPGAICGR
jgi:hypothetical protein